MHIIKREAAARIQAGIARKDDFARLGAEDVLAIKGDQDATQYRFLELGAKADPSDADGRTFEHYASTEHVDSMGDIIRQKGWDLSRLKLGRIPLFWGHSSWEVPMGLVMRGKREKMEDGVPALVTTSRFHEPELFGDCEWGLHVDAVRKLVARGDMPGCSVGFVPLTTPHWPTPEEREEQGIGPFGVIFNETELLELSITPIPANSHAQMKKHQAAFDAALKDLVANGQVSEATAQELRGELAVSSDSWLARVKALRKAVVPIVRSLPWAVSRVTVTDLGAGPAPEPAALPSEILSLVGAAVDTAVRDFSRGARAALRTAAESAEGAILEAVDRLEEAAGHLETGNLPTSERVAGGGKGGPKGSPAPTADPAGTSQQGPTPKQPVTAADVLQRAVERL